MAYFMIFRNHPLPRGKLVPSKTLIIYYNMEYTVACQPGNGLLKFLADILVQTIKILLSRDCRLQTLQLWRTRCCRNGRRRIFSQIILF